MNGDYDYRGEPADPKFMAAQIPFLAGVNEDELRQLFHNAAFVQDLSPGEDLYKQDMPVKEVFILLEGQCKQARVDTTESGAVIQTLQRTVGPGALIGFYDFLYGEQFQNLYRSSATTIESCSVLSIDAIALNRLLYRFPQIRDKSVDMSLINRLRTIPLVGRLDTVTLGFLADALAHRSYPPNMMVYSSGDDDKNIFLIDQGQVKLDWGNETRWLGNGAAFCPDMSSGDDDFSSSSAHSAQTTTSSELLVITHRAFYAIVGWDPLKMIMEKAKARELALENLFEELFQQRSFSIDQRNLLSGFMSHYYFPTNRLVIQQGDEANSLWVLMEGGKAAIHASTEDGEKLQTTISSGPTYFAETALLGQVTQDSTVEALAGGEWLRLYWRDFQDYDEAEPVDMRSLLAFDPPVGEVSTSKRHQRRYPWLHRGEIVVLFSRRHWIAYLRKGIPAFIAFAILLGITILGALIPGVQWWIAIPFGIAALAALFLFVWGTIDYFNDWIVVTNRRVVHQEKMLFISEWRKEAPLEQVQNVNFQSTFIGKWLNYGTMVIETASTAGVIRFDYTTHFDRLNAAIMEQRRHRRRHTVAQSKLAIHQTLEKRLGLNLDLPKQVFQSDKTRTAKPGWRQRAAERVTPTLRRQAGDQIIWRRHWMVLLPRLWWALLILGFWIVLLIILTILSVQAQDSLRNLVTLIEIIAIFSSIVALLRVAWVVANWRNDTYEVSNETLVHIEKLPFAIVEDRKSASLGNIQNVDMRINSPIQWIFNYGNVVCQTAAEEGDFKFDGVPDPRAVADEILRRIELFRRQQEERAAIRRAEDLPDWFEIYNTLEPEGPAEKQLR